MAIDISTLGVSYGVQIDGATLSGILNAATEVAVTGDVVYGGTALTLDNPVLKVVGSGAGRIRGSLPLYVRNFSVIEGVSLSPSYVQFPEGAAVSGTVRNIPSAPCYFSFAATPNSIALKQRVDARGLLLDNIGGNPQFWGAVQGMVLRNTSCVSRSATPAFSINGDYNLMENCIFDGAGYTIAAKFQPLNGTPSSRGNVFRSCTFTNAREEATGYDCLGPTTCRLVGQITALGSDTLVLSTLHGPVDSAFTNGMGMGPPLEGSNSVGMFLLVCNGAGRGRYYRIEAQEGNSVVLDTSAFSLGGVSVGDVVTINIAFVENEYDGCTVQLTNIGYTADAGYGQHVGISLWGSCFGNYCHDNVITSYVTPTYSTQSCGINDGGAILLNGGDYSYSLNSKNIHVNNRSNNCYEDLRLTTFYYNDTYENTDTGYFEGLGKVTETDLGIMSMGIQCYGHIGSTPSGYVSLHNVLDAVWGDNATAAPSLVYDERYQSAKSGQPPLGGPTSTTFADEPLRGESSESFWGAEGGTLIASADVITAEGALVALAADTGGLAGNIAGTDSLLALSGDTGSLVGILAAEGVVLLSSLGLGGLVGALYSQDLLVSVTATEGAIVEEVLSGGGSIRSPNGAALSLRTTSGQPLTIRSYRDGNWQ